MKINSQNTFLEVSFLIFVLKLFLDLLYITNINWFLLTFWELQWVKLCISKLQGPNCLSSSFKENQLGYPRTLTSQALSPFALSLSPKGFFPKLNSSKIPHTQIFLSRVWPFIQLVQLPGTTFFYLCIICLQFLFIFALFLCSLSLFSFLGQGCQRGSFVLWF